MSDHSVRLCPRSAWTDLALLLAALITAASQAATCEPGWLPGEVTPGTDGDIGALIMFDFDGTGPNPAELVALGDFQLAGGVPALSVAAWNGSTWRAVGEGFDGWFDVRAAAAFDPDGDGPAPVELYAGGFSFNRGPEQGLVRWNGREWTDVGGGLDDATVNALAVFDPDGAGPLESALIVAGDFELAGGVPDTRNIARWDGESWAPLGLGLPRTAECMVTWDPDGSGPQPERLVVGGKFGYASGLPVNHIAIWDGESWSSIGGGLNDEVYIVTTFDTDGAGSDVPVLVAGGSFTEAGEVPVHRIAMWDGASWSPMGEGLTNLPDCALQIDWDEDGPSPPVLLVGDACSWPCIEDQTQIVSWDGIQWTPFAGGFGNPVPPGFGNGRVSTLAWCDPDGAGELPSQLYVGGFFDEVSGLTVYNIARWDGRAWRPLGESFDSSIQSLTVHDLDGDGEGGPQLIASGDFTAVAGTTTMGVASWDGSKWSPIGDGLLDHGYISYGSGLGDVVTAVHSHDPDGIGLLPSLLYAGRTLFSLGDDAPAFVSTWDGRRWTDLPPLSLPGSDAMVYDLTSHDPDGDGPQEAVLVVVGRFLTAGSMVVNSVASWDGKSWLPIGAGITLSGGSPASVLAVVTFDSDGDGPQPSSLFASQLFGSLRRWNGVTWEVFASGSFLSTVRALKVVDLDGTGPLSEVLVVGGDFSTFGGVPANGIAKWNGSRWGPFGQGIQTATLSPGSVRAIEVIDVDGDGTRQRELVVGGKFALAGGSGAAHIARWDGTSWHAMGAGVGDIFVGVNVLQAIDHDDDSSSPDMLAVGGDFLSVDGEPTSYLAWWGCTTATTDPADLDQDGDVDGFDLATLLGAWTGTRGYVPCQPLQPADLNGDCRIDGFDLAILLGAWG